MNKRLFFVFLTLYLLTASGRIDSGDGQAMFQVTHSTVHGWGFIISDAAPDQDFIGAKGESIPREAIAGSSYGSFGVDGRYYAASGPGQSLAAVPFYLLGELAHAVFPAWSESFWTRVCATLLNTFVTAGTVMLVAATARLFFDEVTSLTVAVLFGVATPAWPYAKSFFNEPLVGGLGLLAGYAAMRARRDAHFGWYALSGVALGAAVFVRPTALLIVLPVGGYLFLTCHPDKTRWFAWGSGLAVSLALLGWYNTVRFGNPLTTGYGSRVQWNVPLWFGGYGLLFSSGKGLVWFAPIVVPAIVALPAFIQKRPAEGWLMVGVVGVFFASHATLNYWHGGGCWGPRYILPIVTWLILPLGIILEHKLRPSWQEWGLAIAIAASIVVQVLAVSVNYARHLQAVYDASSSSEEYFQRVQFSWADSPIIGQARGLLAVSGNLRQPDRRAALGALVASTLVAPERDDPFYDARTEALGYLGFNAPDFWFVYGWLLGMPVAVIVVTAAALSGVFVASVWSLRRALRLSLSNTVC